MSDNATSFTASEFKDFLKVNCISHVTAPPYMPSSNGQGERAVRVVKDLLRKNTVGNFQNRLNNILLHYRTTHHSVTKIPPCIALNNRSYITVKEKVNPNFVSIENKTNKNIRSFHVGNNVLVLNLREGSKWLTATVVGKLGNDVYEVYVHQLQVIWKRHVNQMLSSVLSASAATPPSLSVNTHFDNTNSSRDEGEVENVPVIPITSEQDSTKDTNPFVTDSENSLSSPVVNNNPFLSNDTENIENCKVPNSVPVNHENDTNEPILRRSTRVRKPVDRYVAS